jgi:hypothetical protein
MLLSRTNTTHRANLNAKKMLIKLENSVYVHKNMLHWLVLLLVIWKHEIK